MSLSSKMLAGMWKLPPRLATARRQRGIRVLADDGTALETELFSPRLKGQRPTLLMRVPYGLTGFATVAECYAERGFHVVLQACRGTGKSGGEFDPLRNERADGLATLGWIEQQPWFDGRLGLSGPSYLGYAQWAISDALPPRSAMATKVTSAEFRSVVFPGGALHLGLWLGWLQTVEGIRTNVLQFSERMLSGTIEKRTLKASMQLPLLDADLRTVGHVVPFWRRWLVEAVDNDTFWQPLDHTTRIGAHTPPNHFISGWYDFMLDQLLRDYQSLVGAGQRPYLTVGPWFHVSPALQEESMRETLYWMQAQLLDDRAMLRDAPVRIHIGGIDAWRDYESYPPGPPVLQTWHLCPDETLAPQPAPASPPDTYRYDPATPTPNLGGAIFAFSGAGPVDNAPLEARPDVLTYTSAPLARAVTVIGQARVALHARASIPHADFFVRLCDVDEAGRSTNICDGFIRATPRDPVAADGSWRLDFPLHATAYAFVRGHRLRVIVASGAHPRYARNTGTDEPLAEAVTLVAADIEIFHDPDHPTTLELPTYDA